MTYRVLESTESVQNCALLEAKGIKCCYHCLVVTLALHTMTLKLHRPAQWESAPSPLSAMPPHAGPTAPETSSHVMHHNPMCPRHLTPAARSGYVPGGGTRNEIPFYRSTNRRHHARSKPESPIEADRVLP